MLFQVCDKEPHRPLSSSRRCRVPQILRFGFSWEKMRVLIFLEGDKSTLKTSEWGRILVGKWCPDWNSDLSLKSTTSSRDIIGDIILRQKITVRIICVMEQWKWKHIFLFAATRLFFFLPSTTRSWLWIESKHFERSYVRV